MGRRKILENSPSSNRGFVFKVVTDGQEQEHLLMMGLPSYEAIPKLKQIEKDLALKLTIVVSSGDMHHLALRQWLEEYPTVKYYMSGLKFPTTRNGQDILKDPTYQKQIVFCTEFYPIHSALQKYSNVIQFYACNQTLRVPDDYKSAKDAQSGHDSGLLKLMMYHATLQQTEPFYCVWGYHVPTKQLAYEHNFHFYMTKEHLATFPFPMNLGFPEATICSAVKESWCSGPKTLKGCREHCQQMMTIAKLESNVRAMMEYHSLPGAMAGTWNTQEEFHAQFIKILKQTGEHDAQALYEYMNKKSWWNNPAFFLIAVGVGAAAAAAAAAAGVHNYGTPFSK